MMPQRNKAKRQTPPCATADGTTARPGPSAPRGGFTLAELLIAIGILGVGLTMAAALFPVGIEANRNSANDLMGTLVCENGLALAKATLRRSQVDQDGQFRQCAIDPANQQYPIDAESYMGFFVLARTVNYAVNDYELLVVSYRRHPEGGNVTLRQAEGTSSTDGDTGTGYFNFSDSRYAQVGSPIMVRDAHYISRAKIVALNEKNATLDVPLKPGGVSVYVVHQEDVPRSPGMRAMSIRTSLRD